MLSATTFPLEVQPAELIQKGRSDAYSLPLREYDEPCGSVSFDVERRTERDVANRLSVDDADKVRRGDRDAAVLDSDAAENISRIFR